MAGDILWQGDIHDSGESLTMARFIHNSEDNMSYVIFLDRHSKEHRIILCDYDIETLRLFVKAVDSTPHSKLKKQIRLV